MANLDPLLIRNEDLKYCINVNISFQEWTEQFETLLIFLSEDYSFAERERLLQLKKEYKSYKNKFQKLISEHPMIKSHSNFYTSLEKVNEELDQKIEAELLFLDRKDPIDPTTASYIYTGIIISKKESGDYELFRNYFSRFNNETCIEPNYSSAEVQFYKENGLNFSKSKIALNYAIPFVPAFCVSDKSWVRALKQRLRKSIDSYEFKMEEKGKEFDKRVSEFLNKQAINSVF